LRTFTIKGETTESKIIIGGKLKHLKKYIDPLKTVVITDSNIIKHYKDELSHYEVVRIGVGEKIKTLRTVELIIEDLIKLGVDRTYTLVGIGGGVVCDITGFVASVYMRGIEFGFVSTSLLSQVDASVGGKTGVNFSGYKNMVGTFNQPKFVICDHEMLRTLPFKEYRIGLAEVVKHAALGNKDLFEFLEKYSNRAKDVDMEIVERVVTESIELKSAIVQLDEKESGVRRKLNFGHTIGHAYEKLLGVSHGDAVSVGMVFAARFSVKMDLLLKSQADRLRVLLCALGLPTTFDVNKEDLKNVIRKDKKRDGDYINFVFLSEIGKAVVRGVRIEDVEEFIDDMC
jgi:3-dehydroquinate synthase